MKVVVPAGGEGSRLFPYTALVPKALLPVGGRPVLHWIVQKLKKHNLTDVTICINKEHCNHFVHETRDYDITINLIVNLLSNLGSAGEILDTKDILKEPFLMHYSDELTPIDLTFLMKYHKATDGIGTLATITNVPLDVGIVESEKSLVKHIVEKPMLGRPAWAGIAVFEPEIFKYIETGDDFARDVFPKLLNDGKKLYSCQSDVLWLDVGSLSHYKKACDLAKQGKL